MKSESPIISQIAAEYFVVATENKYEFLLSSLGFLLVFDRILMAFRVFIIWIFIGIGRVNRAFHFREW